MFGEGLVACPRPPPPRSPSMTASHININNIHSMTLPDLNDLIDPALNDPDIALNDLDLALNDLDLPRVVNTRAHTLITTPASFITLISPWGHKTRPCTIYFISINPCGVGGEINHTSAGV